VFSFPSAWKFRLNVTSGTFTFSNFVIRRTLTGSTTYIDSTAVTFGGTSAPLMSAGWNQSDTISVALDTDHDYYILGYISAASSGVAAWTAGNDAASPEAVSGWLAGNQTAAATMSYAFSTAPAYGMPEYYTA
jgi:hypothetical protein